MTHPPALKTKAFHFASEEERVNIICCYVYKQIIQPYLSLQSSSAIAGNGFCYFPPVRQLHFLKPKYSIMLVTNEGWIKHLLLLFKRIMQRYLILLLVKL